MHLEDYLEFDPCDRIRVRGSRIAIEDVLSLYHQGLRPEQIVSEHFPTLSLEEVYATITYYLHNQSEVDAYLKRNEAADEAFHQELQRREPSEVVKRLLAHRGNIGTQ